MALESLLEPLKWDKQLLMQYAKVSKKFGLDEGLKRYLICGGFWMAHFVISDATGSRLIGANELGVRILLDFVDYNYNLNGMIGNIKDEGISETRAINPLINVYKIFNSIVRLPTFATGIALIGKSGADLFNYVTNGEPIDSSSYNCLMYGMGLLPLASSMYIKDANPKTFR